MKIILSPQMRNDSLKLEKLGNVLVVNGESFDFSRMRDGDRLPVGSVISDFIVGEVVCIAGELELTVITPLYQNYTQEQAFPKPIADAQDGVVMDLKPVQRTDEAVLK